MSSFTLDNIREAAEARYGSLDIDFSEGKCTMLNPLRLAKDKRDALQELQTALEEKGSDQEALLADAIVLVSSNEEYAKKLIAEIDGDLTVLAQIFETYGKVTQAGEASASDD